MDDRISMPAAKAVTAIGAAVTSQVSDTVITTSASLKVALLDFTWPNIASFAAAIYSLCLVTEWFWKKVWRPLCLRKGWLPWLVKPDREFELTPAEKRQIAIQRRAQEQDTEL
jgi:hypothetical protein